MFIKSKWLAFGAYVTVFLIILSIYGTIPFLSIPTLGQVVWTSGFAESFVNADWPSIKAVNFGLPDKAAIAFGLAGAFLQSAFIAVFGMHPADAYALGAVVWLALSLWGAIRLCQFLGTSFVQGSFLSLIYLTLPIVWWHDRYSMLSFGFALLPLYLYIAFMVIYRLPEIKIYSKDWWITVCTFAAVFLLSVFMDGYTFVMFFAACGLIWFVAFIRKDVTRKLLVFQSLPVILLSALLSYLLYTLYVGTSEYSPSPMSFFRGWGVDLVMLLIPSQGVGWLWDALGISVPRSSSDFFGDASVWMTTFALPLIIVGVTGYCLARKNRYALPLLLVALIGFYFSLGPSLKVDSVRPVDENGKVLVQGQLMPPEVAIIPTGNAVIYEHVPGFNSMRATYRWSGLMFTALWGLTVLFVISISLTNIGFLISSIIIVFLIVSNLPDVPNRLKQGMNYHSAMHQMDTDFVPLADYLGKGARVLFAPPGNDFIVNYLAATGNYRAFNIGGDKNLEIARKAWPQPIKQMQLFSPGPYFVEELKIILLNDVVDYVVIPYFDMLWGAHAWPPNRNEIISRKEQFSQMVDMFEKDSLFNVKNEKLYTLISLSPDANRQHIQSAIREVSMIYDCQPPQCLNWEAKREDIPTQVGKRVSGAVRSTGQSGFLVFGPYKPMKAGNYMLELRGIIHSTNGRVITDVVGDKGQCTFARFEELDGVNSSNASVLLNKAVVLDKAISDLEVRVWVDELADIELYGYSLRPVD
ncbi:hypothetical protein SPSYN_00796 [Sporotomaculum syntrophicum]|uniref:Uncharacterized protein n=1 Tax=Sporotomaculum syntrophicum TaxID=182264 RepID=A0A9D2WS24_9FIRM|nr:hypothetical protein [Sporotomaculum syntrophicum]KAF1086058.1 hypothetical protein SPSYN_00796 [Sporotomaculum syntrophicum]